MPAYKKENNRNKTTLLISEKKTEWVKYLYITILAVITFFTFASALQNNFTNWDDPDYVTENPYIKDFTIKGIQNIFSVFVSNHYHPLTILSLAVDYKIWGMNARAFILSNIIIHILNSILVFIILTKYKPYHLPALLCALIFAVHPMRLESVIWISERKDVLYVFFYLLAIWFYMRYLNSGMRIKLLFTVLLMAVLSLLSKVSAASLPLLLFVFDFFYKRNDYKRMFVEKLPFLLLSLIFGLIAIKAQSDAIANTFPVVDKIFMFTNGLCFYLYRFFIPLQQTPLIEFPEKNGFWLPYYYYVTVLIIPLLIIIYFKLKSLRNAYLFSLLFFVITVFMVFIKYPVGPAYLAERYTYLPYVGMSLFLMSFYSHYAKSKKIGYFLVITIFWLLFLSIKANSGIAIWKNSNNLWTHVIKYKSESKIAYINRGNFKDSQGDFQGAIADFSEVIKLDTLDDMAYFNRGLSFKNLGDYKAALNDLDRAVMIKPQYDAYYYRGNVKGLLGNYEGAIDDFDAALTYAKGDVNALLGRGTARLKMGYIDDAIIDFNTLLKDNPNNADVLMMRANAFSLKMEYDNALKDLDAAAAISPEISDIYLNKGIVLHHMNKTVEACNQWLKATELGSKNALILYDEWCRVE